MDNRMWCDARKSWKNNIANNSWKRQEAKLGVSRTDSDPPSHTGLSGFPPEPAPGGKDDKVKRSLMSLISPGKHISSARPGHSLLWRVPTNNAVLHPRFLSAYYFGTFMQLYATLATSRFGLHFHGFGSFKSGWWLTYPSEKYESQLGWWHSQLNGKS